MNGRLERLTLAHELYWQGKESPLTDEEYDNEIRWLKKTYPKHYLLQKIGGGIIPEKRVRHDPPMLSLDKAYSFEEIQKFIKTTARDKFEKYSITIKYDGLAGKWENGILSTRGNGEIGENITHKLPLIQLIRGQQKSEFPEEIIFGEIVCHRKIWEKYKGEYKHPRNFTVGIISSKEKIDPHIRLDFVEYISSPTFCIQPKNFNEDLWKEILAYFEKFTDYPKDGLVIRITDREYFEELGYTAHHPKGAIAFKFQNQTAQSTLKRIEWSPGRRYLTPVAIIHPVAINNVTISRVSLHNYQYVIDNKIAKNDLLTIERSGDVIPHIVDIDHDSSNQIENIKNCPYCGTPLEIELPEIYCPNNDCPGRTLSRLRAMVKEAEIDWLGHGALEKLIFKWNIKELSEIYAMSKKQMLEAGLGEKMSAKIIASINDHRSMTPEKFLASCAIDNIGKILWKTVLKKIPFDDICLGKIDRQELLTIPHILDITARKIIQGVRRRKREIESLLKQIKILDGIPQAIGAGKTICFTGKMPEPRSYYEKLATENGYEPVNSVTKDLSVLVCNDLFSTSTKIQKAKKSKIEILTLEEWLKETQK